MIRRASRDARIELSPRFPGRRMCARNLTLQRVTQNHGRQELPPGSLAIIRHSRFLVEPSSDQVAQRRRASSRPAPLGRRRPCAGGGEAAGLVLAMDGSAVVEDDGVGATIGQPPAHYAYLPCRIAGTAPTPHLAGREQGAGMVRTRPSRARANGDGVGDVGNGISIRGATVISTHGSTRAP
jgi:hypothetical protein